MLFSYFGNMMCGKTEKLIKIYNTSVNELKNVFVLVPSKFRNRTKFFPSELENSLQSRAGIEVSVDYYIDENDSKEWFRIIEEIQKICKDKPLCIFIDEINQMAPAFIKFIENFAKQKNVNVYCFGLRKDCFKKMYETSALCFELSNNVEILSKLCDNCKDNLSEFDLTTDINNLINAKYYQICYSCEKNGFQCCNT